MTTTLQTENSLLASCERYYSVQEAFDLIDRKLIKAFGEQVRPQLNASRREEGWDLL
jgi:hypothetical protein